MKTTIENLKSISCTTATIENYMAENGYHMEQTIRGHWYCERTDEEGVEHTVWDDVSCEDAYDYEAAVWVVRSIIAED